METTMRVFDYFQFKFRKEKVVRYTNFPRNNLLLFSSQKKKKNLLLFCFFWWNIFSIIILLLHPFYYTLFLIPNKFLFLCPHFLYPINLIYYIKQKQNLIYYVPTNKIKKKKI
jgi:hypothetical protein